ncbi:MAG TPA: pilus assembly protein PilP [Myxococcota bacterium]|jgi:Tfp pilus assembly protein PilP
MMLALALAVALTEPRDPFHAVVDDKAVITSPLQAVPVDALKLQGIVATASPRAMVVVPSGAVFIVRVGDVVGDRGGVIKSISAAGVVVREDMHNALGEHFASTHVLKTR